MCPVHIPLLRDQELLYVVTPTFNFFGDRSHLHSGQTWEERTFREDYYHGHQL